jgi:hypothetical protein
VSENFMIECLDEIIRRSTLRLEQETVTVGVLLEGGHDQFMARTRLARGTAALDALKLHRSRYEENSWRHAKG